MVKSRRCNEGLKKGPWTPEEDHKLFCHIQEHGPGSWRTLPSKAGLERCGKSCRLRWTNYLRPGIKRGHFTMHEDQSIIHLHALLGNRWAAIASYLPCRTDNEVKNDWHTHLKKRFAKMGIDPTTHKRQNVAFLCSQATDTAKLSHMAQWEAARVEAEARFSIISKPIVPIPHQRPFLDQITPWANPGKNIPSACMVGEDTLSLSEASSGMCLDDARHRGPEMDNQPQLVPASVGLSNGINSPFVEGVG